MESTKLFDNLVDVRVLHRFLDSSPEERVVITKMYPEWRLNELLETTLRIMWQSPDAEYKFFHEGKQYVFTLMLNGETKRGGMMYGGMMR